MLMASDSGGDFYCRDASQVDRHGLASSRGTANPARAGFPTSRLTMALESKK